MNESKIINILVALSLIFVITGGFLLFQQGWFNKDSSLNNIIESGKNKINQVSILKLIPELTGLNEEKTYLVLFQNNLELRPSGGYLGSFGILKVKDAKISSFNVHDTNIFDGFGKIQTDPPKPFTKLNVFNWQMRDGNWSPDFPTSAQQVEYFYQLQGGQESFDGVFGLNATVLPKLLELTGNIYLSEFDKEFKTEDVLYQLEYEVEKGYIERGINSGERKTILKSLVKEVLNKLFKENIWDQTNLKDLILKELDSKNIVIFLKDIENQKIISNLNWDGAINKFYNNDYLMIVEANLGAKKSNAFIEREIEYSVDLTKAKPEVNLKIKYIHKEEQKDWFNDDYRAYLRVYTPYKSWLLETKNVKDETIFSEELSKTVFNNWIEVLTGKEKIIEFSYLLPERIKQDNEYKILIQKQIGVNEILVKLIVKDKDGVVHVKEEMIHNDWEGIISF